MSDDHSEAVARVLDRARKLPSMPSIVLEILQSIDDERMDIATLAGKIANDQALVARVMRVANSAFFGLSGQIGTISEAISILGFNNLRGLVTAAAIINSAPKNLGNFDQLTFWRHGLCTAACARVLAKRCGLNPEVAFTAGVLHDIGKLVIAMQLPEDADAMRLTGRESTDELLKNERALIGFDHALLGGELARRWNFPPVIGKAIELHHISIDASSRGGLSDIVFVANLFSHALNDGKIDESKAGRLAAEARERLLLEPDELPALAEEAQRLYAGSVLLVSE